MKKPWLYIVMLILFLSGYFAQLAFAEDMELIQLLTKIKKIESFQEEESLRKEVAQIIEAKKMAIKKAVWLEVKGKTSGKDEVTTEKADEKNAATGKENTSYEITVDAEVAKRFNKRVRDFLETRDSQGKTAIFLAAELGSIGAIAALYEDGANIYFSPEKNGPTALSVIDKNWPENWPSPWFNSENDHVPWSQLRPLMRLRSLTRRESNGEGLFHIRDQIAHVVGFLKDEEFLHLRGVNWGGYSHFITPYVIKHAENQHTISNENWKTFRRYDPRKFWIIPGLKFKLALKNKKDLSRFLKDEELQKKLKGLSFVDDERVAPATWRDLSKFENLELLFVRLNYSDREGYRAVSEEIPKLGNLQTLTMSLSDENGGNQDIGYSELAKAVNLNPSLTSLSFHNHAKGFFNHFGNHISEENNIRKIALSGSALSGLWAGNTILHDPYGKGFINFFKKMKRLEHIEFQIRLYKSDFLKMIEVFMFNPSIKYLSFPSHNAFLYDDLRYHRFVNSNDKEVFETLKALKKKHPYLKIVFGGQEFESIDQQGAMCGIL